jgi:hypothetical protein
MGSVHGIVRALDGLADRDPILSRPAATVEDIKFERKDFCVDGMDTSQARNDFTTAGISDRDDGGSLSGCSSNACQAC